MSPNAGSVTRYPAVRLGRQGLSPAGPKRWEPDRAVGLELTWGRSDRSAARDLGDDDVGGVSVEVLAASVVDGRGARVSVSRSDLHVTEGNAGVEGGHDERRAEHVRVHRAESGTFRDRGDPSVGGASLESLSVCTAQDRACAAFADGEVDGAGGAWGEGDDGGLVALPDDAQGAMSAFEREVFDVGRTCFADA